MASKGKKTRSISVSSGIISTGTKKRHRSDPGLTKKTKSTSKSKSKSTHKIPTPPPLPPVVKNTIYKPMPRTPSPKDALNLNQYAIYHKTTNPIGFTFLSSGALNGADYLYDIKQDIEYNRHSRKLKNLTRREIINIELNNDEFRQKYAYEHGIILKKGGSKTGRNKNPRKKTKRRMRFTRK